MQKCPAVTGCIFTKITHISGEAQRVHAHSSAGLLPSLACCCCACQFEGCLLAFLYLQSALGVGLICGWLSPFGLFTGLGAPAELAGHRCGHSASAFLVAQFSWGGHGAFAGAYIFYSSSVLPRQVQPDTHQPDCKREVLDPKRDASPIRASQWWTWPLGRILATPAHLQNVYLQLSHEHLKTQASGREKSRMLA